MKAIIHVQAHQRAAETLGEYVDRRISTANLNPPNEDVTFQIDDWTKLDWTISSPRSLIGSELKKYKSQLS